jgi:hypothetical protein
MTRRVLLAALAVTFVLPAAATAQAGAPQADRFHGPRLQITPYVGHLTSIKRVEEWGFTGGTESFYSQAEVELGGATAFGVQLESPLAGDFGLSAAGTYGARDATRFVVLNSGDRRRVEGPHVFLGRLSLAYHLPPETSEFVLRRVGASAFAGGVVLHERPRNSAATGVELDSGTSFGVNLGIAAEIPFSRDRFTVNLAVEDNLIWWDEQALASLPFEYLGRPGQRDQTVVSANMSHAWLLRAGISIRLH